MVDVSALGLLGGHVGYGAEDLADGGPVLDGHGRVIVRCFLGQLGETEVEHLHAAV